MNRRALRFSSEAGHDVVTIRAWLEDVRPGLGEEFLDELDRLADGIRENAALYQRFRGECRRAVFRNLDYALVYRVLPDCVEVVGVLHCRLNPMMALARTERGSS